MKKYRSKRNFSRKKSPQISVTQRLANLNQPPKKDEKKKEKITFWGSQATSLLTLYVRAHYTKDLKHNFINDKSAVNALKKIDYDFEKLKLNKKSEIIKYIGIAIRSCMIDNLTTSFLQRENERQKVVVNLGCGLDERYGRIIEKKNKKSKKLFWFDLDFDSTIELRESLFEHLKTNEKYQTLKYSVTNFKWITQLKEHITSLNVKNYDILFNAEGLFMYLLPKDVKNVFLKISQEFKGGKIIFDANASLAKSMVEDIHGDTFEKMGVKEFTWFLDDPKDIEKWDESGSIKFVEEKFMYDFKGIDKIPPIMKDWYTGKFFQHKKRVSRILVFNL